MCKAGRGRRSLSNACRLGLPGVAAKQSVFWHRALSLALFAANRHDDPALAVLYVPPHEHPAQAASGIHVKQ
jgi:hypothetical protein